MNASTKRAVSLAIASSLLVAIGSTVDAGETSLLAKMTPDLARLIPYVGAWNVTEQHFDTRGKRVGSVKGTEQIEWILDGRALQRRYITSSKSAVYRAKGTMGWNTVTKRYQLVWFDNASTTGPTTMIGEWNEKSRTMVYQVQSTGPDGKITKRKVVEIFDGEDTRIATTYLLRGSEVIKQLEVVYKRTTPCPGSSSIRIVDELNDND